MDVIVISPPPSSPNESLSTEEDVIIIENLVEEDTNRNTRKERNTREALANLKKRRNQFLVSKRKPEQEATQKPKGIHLSDLVQVFMNEVDRLTTTGKYNINLHHNIKHRSFEYECHHENCKHSYISKSHLDKHLLKHHGDRTHTYTCNKCSIVFHDKVKFSYHNKLHPHIKIPCNNCESIFEEELQMKEHKLKCLETPAKQCGDNNLIIDTSSCTETALVKCDSTVLECHICTSSKIYASRWHLKRHINRLHSCEEYFKCIRCQNRFVSRSMWHSHKFKCSTSKKNKGNNKQNRGR